MVAGPQGPRPNAARRDPLKRCGCYFATEPLAGGGGLMRGVAKSDSAAGADALAIHLAE